MFATENDEEMKSGTLFIGLLFAMMPAEPNPACKAASAPVNYGSGLSISESTRTLIESYRSDWKNLCDPKGRRKPALAEVFVKAKQIEADFKKVFDAFDDSILNDAKFDVRRLDIVTDLVSVKYPEFVPAFHGAYGDHEYFSPSVEVFRKSGWLGDSQDRLFFESHIPLEGEFPPFVTRTWDYGGCDQFGEYDWTGALKNVGRVKSKVKSPAYLKEASQFEELLFSKLGATFDICTCKDKSAVVPDLIKVRDYLKKEPRFTSQLLKVQQTLDSIQSGKLKINSEKEKRCSGG